jgi:hypothetical protein
MRGNSSTCTGRGSLIESDRVLLGDPAPNKRLHGAFAALLCRQS